MANLHVDSEGTLLVEIRVLLGADACHRFQQRDGGAAVQVAVRLENLGHDGHRRLDVALVGGNGLDVQRIGQRHGSLLR